MNLQEAIAKITGVTERLEKLDAEKSTAQAELEAAQTKISELEAKLKDAPDAAKISDLEGQVKTLTAEVGAEKARADKAEKDLTDYKDGATARENLAAAHIAASNGLPGPVATTGANKGEQAASTVTRAQFDAMNHADRKTFFKNKGRIDG